MRIVSGAVGGSAHELPKKNGTEKPALVFAIVLASLAPVYARLNFLP